LLAESILKSELAASYRVSLPPERPLQQIDSTPMAKKSKPAAKNDSRVTTHTEWFSTLAHATAHWAGHPITFLACVALVLVWAATGPLFGYSDTWQLVINTSTTIVTFLMVFLIQNTQNRDTLALQIKLAELIRAASGAKNRLATAEDLTEKELEELHKEYCAMAEQALGHLEIRRGASEK
jgi:low affinity Fe/Cu permease